MKKIEYISPMVEITTWAKADVITTSGVVKNTTAVAEITDNNYTSTIDYKTAFGE